MMAVPVMMYVVASCLASLACCPICPAGDGAGIKELTEQQMSNWLQCLFLFSLVWSIGGLTDDEGRKKFDTQLRKLLQHDPLPELKHYVTGTPVKINVPFPEGKLVYDFMFDKTKCKWVPWLDTIESKPLDPDMEYSNIIVPTVDTVRYTYLLDKLVLHNKHCLFVGPTGTGKVSGSALWQ